MTTAEVASRWDFACPDWVERLRRGDSLVPDLPLDQKRVDTAVEVFNRLRLPDVPGQPEMREAAGDWFRDIVAALFGSVDATGSRRVSEILALVPKKQSKTTGGAAIMLEALILNKRPRGRFLLVGPTQEIADLAFGQAVGMIEADPFLAKRFHIRDHIKTIEDRTNGATLKIKTFDMKVMTGTPPVGVLLDELHLMSADPRATRILGQIRGGMITNPESFLLIITTQSDQPPAGVFRTELQYARGVRDGLIKGDTVRMLPILYEFPEAMQTAKDKPWLDTRNWPMVLPNLGLSVTIERLVGEFEGAKERGDAEIRRWASQHLNVEIGLALHTDRWRGADYWEAAADKTLTLDSLIERCEVAVIGIDGGGLDDLFGMCVGGRCRETRNWLFWYTAWATEEVFVRRKDIAERLDDFVKAGELRKVDTITEAIAGAAAIVKRVKDAYLLPAENAIGFDNIMVSALYDALLEIEIEEDQLASINTQAWSMSSAIWGIEHRAKEKTFFHQGARLMNWCVGNGKIDRLKNSVLITKQTSGKAKIDPLIAGFNAAKLLERNPQAVKPAEYDVFFV